MSIADVDGMDESALATGLVGGATIKVLTVFWVIMLSTDQWNSLHLTNLILLSFFKIVFFGTDLGDLFIDYVQGDRWWGI